MLNLWFEGKQALSDGPFGTEIKSPGSGESEVMRSGHFVSMQHEEGVGTKILRCYRDI